MKRMRQHAVLCYAAILHFLHSVACLGQWSMSYEPRFGVCALKGSDVSMTCSYKYPANLSVQRVFWTLQSYGGQSDLVSDSEYAGRAQVDCGDRTSRCTLHLSRVTVEDQRHKYYCRVITQQEKEKWTGRPGMNLSVTDLQVRSPGHLKEGKGVYLTCFTTCTLSGSPRFVWTKDGQVVGETSKTLHLDSLSRSDEGNYMCAVKGHENFPSPALRISITYAPKDVSVFVRPSRLIDKGSSVTLFCVCDANPLADMYTWYKTGNPASLGSGQQYSITNIGSEDAGRYYCKAKNDQGESDSTHVVIKIADPPQEVWVFRHPSGPVPKGSSVTLACVSDANPPVENYTWFKNNVSTSVGSGQLHIIRNISSEDAGLYFCEASSNNGAQMSNGTDIRTGEEYLCVAAASVGVLSGSVLVTLSSVILFRCRSRRRENAEDFIEDSDDEADEKPKPGLKFNSQEEEDDYGDYENCEYGNTVQMDSYQENMDVYDAPQDNDVYQNVVELSM